MNQELLGTIYKITNLINNKVYIGQTKQYYLDRWSQHKSHAKTGLSNHKLARALRKYGEENFIIEIVEQCSYEELDEKETYWIEYYDSIKNGYNILTGGQKNRLFYELENQQDIIDYYYECHNQQKTCEHFNITDYKLRQLLTKNNLPTDKTNYGKHTKEAIKIVELDKIFESGVDCAKFFIENNLCQTKKLECAKTRISYGINHHTKVYGFTIIKI